MTLFSAEHYEIFKMFENEFEGVFDKFPKEDWSKGNIYKDEITNKLFLAYRKGYAFGKSA